MDPSQLSMALRKIATKLDSSNNPIKERVIASILGTVRSISSDDRFSWLEPISSHTTPSDLVWHAFKNIGRPDWDDNLNPNMIIKEIRNIISQHPELSNNLNKAVKYTQKNYDRYLELKASGEI